MAWSRTVALSLPCWTSACATWIRVARETCGDEVEDERSKGSATQVTIPLCSLASDIGAVIKGTLGAIAENENQHQSSKWRRMSARPASGGCRFLNLTKRRRSRSSRNLLENFADIHNLGVARLFSKAAGTNKHLSLRYESLELRTHGCG